MEVRFPQGNPISPLLFVIYVAPLHEVPIAKGLTLPYVIDLALTKDSKSHRQNIIFLQAALDMLQVVGRKLHINFSIPKTDFIH
jgi:hypothetical protein